MGFSILNFSEPHQTAQSRQRISVTCGNEVLVPPDAVGGGQASAGEAIGDPIPCPDDRTRSDG
jgi:hypothetical protein